MKFLVIKGNVLGGHYIPDMGLQVPYGQEVRVPYDRATWSRDMTSAIEKGMVIRVSITQAPAAPLLPPGASRRRSTPTVNPRPEAKAASTNSGEAIGQVNIKALQDMNTALVERLDNLTSAQTKMMTDLAAMLGDLALAPQSYAPNPGQGSTTLDIQGLGKTPPRKGSKVVEEEDDPVIFIPSKIRSGDLKVPQDSAQAVEESQKESATLNDASAALSAMRKKSKKTKKTTKGKKKP